MSEDVRSHALTLNVPNPVEDQEITLIGSMLRDFTVTAVHHNCFAGTLNVNVHINGSTVGFDEAESNGTIVADEGPMDRFDADVDNAGSAGDLLGIHITNLSSDPPVGYFIQIDILWDQEEPA